MYVKATWEPPYPRLIRKPLLLKDIAPLPSAKTVHNQVLAAASFGGPVWIPKVFNGRNKVFFFFAGERSRAKDIVSNSLISVPTAEARAGNLNGNLGANGLPIVIYNPFD